MKTTDTDIHFKLYNAHVHPDPEFNEERIAQFLFKHLEQYGDPVEDIQKCIDFVLERNGGLGGHIILAVMGDEIAGAVVANKTGMSGYIPENILVYIAVDGTFRGKGIGKQLIEQLYKITSGDIALHVEPDNPAKRLYERLGFTQKYAEMRYKRS